jgi:hypothetical protein
MIKSIKYFIWSRKFPLGALFIVLAGFFWLLFNLQYSDNHFTLCFFKNITGYACPACGMTRAMVAFLQGHFLQALYYNPLLILFLVLVFIISPAMFSDLIYGNNKLKALFEKIDRYFAKKRIIAVIFFILLILNWIWNLNKY